MLDREEFIKSVFEITTSTLFNDLALELFRHQAIHVDIFREFLNQLHVDPLKINDYRKIPHLPISFFKSHKVISNQAEAKITFSSSGTTGSFTSKHHLAQPAVYEKSFKSHFYHSYGSADDLIILALLPSYLERSNSSLIYMVKELIEDTKNPDSGFYLNDYQALSTKISELKKSNKRLILFGVTFALLELADKFPGAGWNHLTIIETGGMKGRGKELTRSELHQELKDTLNVHEIHSEYGMTEMLSQAYSTGEWFTPPAWLRINIREIDDPLQLTNTSKTGGINVTDLANIDSCAFIATDDLGQLDQDGKFKVLGRFDHSDTRGCNLLVQDI